VPMAAGLSVMHTKIYYSAPYCDGRTPLVRCLREARCALSDISHGRAFSLKRAEENNCLF
jgi:hypothetical protein